MNLVLTGLAGSGKDTVAKVIQEINPTMQSVALAKPIKQMVNTLFGWGSSESDGENKEVDLTVVVPYQSILNTSALLKDYLHPTGITTQYSSIELIHYVCYNIFKLDSVSDSEGTEFKGVISPRQAYQKFGTEFGRMYLDTDVWLRIAGKREIITDGRFPNEIDWFKKRGYSIVKIHEVGGSNTVANGHQSEQGIPDHMVDYHIYNDKSKPFSCLRNEVKEAYDTLKSVIK